MANNPTVGVFIPGNYLNQCNSPYPTGQGDVYGNSYPSGLNVGKQIEIGTTLAQISTNPAGANQLFEGAYQGIGAGAYGTADRARRSRSGGTSPRQVIRHLP